MEILHLNRQDDQVHLSKVWPIANITDSVNMNCGFKTET